MFFSYGGYVYLSNLRRLEREGNLRVYLKRRIRHYSLHDRKPYPAARVKHGPFWPVYGKGQVEIREMSMP